MCDDHGSHDDVAAAGRTDGRSSSGLSRRSLFRGAAALGGGLLAGGAQGLLYPAQATPVPVASSLSPVNDHGLLAYRHAMHVHTSYSEGIASLEAQIVEASSNGFDTLWTTDHDWRMNAYEAPEEFHFTDLTERLPRGRYTWEPSADGELASAEGATRAGAASPADPAITKGGLVVRATSAGRAAATYRYTLDGTSRANDRQRTNLAGTVLLLEVRPRLRGLDAWGTVEVLTSLRPALGDRNAGRYRLVYELGLAPAQREASERVGRIRVPVVDGAWNAVRLDPVADLAALWPDLVAADNHLTGLSLGTTSRRGARGAVAYSWLRFERSGAGGDDPLVAQREIIAEYALRYPSLTVRQGIEVSGISDEHSNWFGGTPHLIDYRQGTPTLAETTALAHTYGCLVSLNHPFGSSNGLSEASAQESARQLVAADLLARAVGGVDVLEAGYRERGGASLETHLDLVDTLWRAGRWVTANGANDNHDGRPGQWASQANRFATSVWQSSAGADDALAALRRGAAFVGELGGFAGFLDLSADGAPMGSASVDPLRTVAELVVRAWELPAGSSVEVVRGPVDYLDAVDPGTSLLARLLDSDLRTGSATVPVPTETSCFVRVQVRTADGRCVAFSNPVFLLKEEPPESRALPAHRRAVV